MLSDLFNRFYFKFFCVAWWHFVVLLVQTILLSKSTFIDEKRTVYIFWVIPVFKFEEEYFQELQKSFKTIDKTLNKLKQEIESAILRANQNKEDIFTIRHLKPMDKDTYVKYMDSLIQNLKNMKLKLSIEETDKVKNIIQKIDERVPFNGVGK